jgi:hypothetical protein
VALHDVTVAYCTPKNKETILYLRSVKWLLFEEKKGEIAIDDQSFWVWGERETERFICVLYSTILDFFLIYLLNF